jgi:cytochrome oxidase Cu insertion factor (SCO1/SenC/PrrC family)
MKKKIIISFLIVAVISVLTFLGYSIVNKAAAKKEVAARLEHIPDFSFTTVDNEEFSNSHLQENLNTIFIYFNSTCDFCQYEAQSISENLDRFDNVQFIFVSEEPKDIIKEFSRTYQLDNKEQITFLHDSLDTFSDRFDATSIPYLLIYDTNGKLIKKHKGQLNANGILMYLNSQS